MDSKPIPIAQGARMKRSRQQTEASIRVGGMGWVMGYKLHAVVTPQGWITRFAVQSANIDDRVMAQELLSPSEKATTLGDRGYVGCGIYARPRSNAKAPVATPPELSRLRKRVETVFSRLARCCSLGAMQLNSFRAVCTRSCRAVAAHNLMLFLEGFKL